MKDLFPVCLSQKHGCALYMVKYSIYLIEMFVDCLQFGGIKNSVATDFLFMSILWWQMGTYILDMYQQIEFWCLWSMHMNNFGR